MTAHSYFDSTSLPEEVGKELYITVGGVGAIEGVKCRGQAVVESG
jgi:hypothetical protein